MSKKLESILELLLAEENEKAEKIRDLCQMIANQSVYSGDKAVLDSTLAQLEGIEKFYKSEWLLNLIKKKWIKLK